MSHFRRLLREHEMLDRYVCTTLEEIRTALKGLNHFSMPIAKRHLASLIEEVQTAVNRMESAIQAGPKVEDLREERQELRREIRKSQQEKLKLEDEE